MKKSTKTGITAGTAALLLALQSFLTGINASRANCIVKVDNAHDSTYAKQKGQAPNLKINASTKCNKDQEYAQLTMAFYLVERSNIKLVHVSDSDRQYSGKKNPKIIYFKGFQRRCISHHPLKYYGEAKGYVKLKNGKRIEVQGKSSEITYVDCVIGTQ